MKSWPSDCQTWKINMKIQKEEFLKEFLFGYSILNNLKQGC